MKSTVRSKYGFSMYPNYLKAVDEFTKGDDEKFGRMMRIICYYGMYGQDITENEIEKLFLTSIIASVDSSVEKRSSGSLGGRGNKKEEAFKKPTVKEIDTYCRERKNHVNAEKFFDYYEAKGWKVGKNPMKNWKASVRTWEKNHFDDVEENVLHSTADVESL